MMENLYSPLSFPPFGESKMEVKDIKPEPLDFDGPLDYFPSCDFSYNVKTEEKPIILKEEESTEKVSFRFAQRFTDRYDSLTKTNLEADQHLVWKKKQLTFQTGVLLFASERPIQVTKINHVEVFDLNGQVLYAQNESDITFRAKRDANEWSSTLIVRLLAQLEKNPEPFPLQFSLSLPNISQARSDGKICLGFPPPSSWIRTSSLFSHVPYFCFERNQVDAIHEDLRLCYDKISTGIYFTLQLDCPNSRGEYFDLTLCSDLRRADIPAQCSSTEDIQKMRVRLLTKLSRKEPISVESLRNIRNKEASMLVFPPCNSPCEAICSVHPPSSTTSSCSTTPASSSPSSSSSSPSPNIDFHSSGSYSAIKSPLLDEADISFYSEYFPFSPLENSPKRCSSFPTYNHPISPPPPFCKPIFCQEFTPEHLSPFSSPKFTENSENARERIATLEKTVKRLQRELLLRRILTIHRGPTRCIGCMMQKHSRQRRTKRQSQQ